MIECFLIGMDVPFGGLSLEEDLTILGRLAVEGWSGVGAEPLFPGYWGGNTGIGGGFTGIVGVRGIFGTLHSRVHATTGVQGSTGYYGVTGVGGFYNREENSENISVFMLGETHDWNSNSGYSRRRNTLPFVTNEAIMAGARSCNYFSSYVIGGSYSGIFHNIIDRIPLRARMAFSRIKRIWNHICNRIWFS